MFQNTFLDPSSHACCHRKSKKRAQNCFLQSFISAIGNLSLHYSKTLLSYSKKLRPHAGHYSFTLALRDPYPRLRLSNCCLHALSAFTLYRYTDKAIHLLFPTLTFVGYWVVYTLSWSSSLRLQLFWKSLSSSDF